MGVGWWDDISFSLKNIFNLKFIIQVKRMRSQERLLPSHKADPGSSIRKSEFQGDYHCSELFLGMLYISILFCIMHIRCE